MRISILIPQHTRLTILIVGLLVTCAQRADAGCGDYLVHGTAQEVLTHSPTVPSPPCEGPVCSQNPSTPVAPMTTAGIPVPDLKAIAATDMNGTEPHDKPLSRDSVAGKAIGLPSSIFHPPRH